MPTYSLTPVRRRKTTVKRKSPVKRKTTVKRKAPVRRTTRSSIALRLGALRRKQAHPTRAPWF